MFFTLSVYKLRTVTGSAWLVLSCSRHFVSAALALKKILRLAWWGSCSLTNLESYRDSACYQPHTGCARPRLQLQLLSGTETCLYRTLSIYLWQICNFITHYFVKLKKRYKKLKLSCFQLNFSHLDILSLKRHHYFLIFLEHFFLALKGDTGNDVKLDMNLNQGGCGFSWVPWALRWTSGECCVLVRQLRVVADIFFLHILVPEDYSFFKKITVFLIWETLLSRLILFRLYLNNSNHLQ